MNSSVSVIVGEILRNSTNIINSNGSSENRNMSGTVSSQHNMWSYHSILEAPQFSYFLMVGLSNGTNVLDPETEGHV